MVMLLEEILERLSITMGRGLTALPPAPIRSALKNYDFTVQDWGIADLDYDGTDAHDLNHRLAFTIFQLHYSVGCQLDIKAIIRRRLEALARHLHSIGINRREPLDFFAAIVTQELKLSEPVEIPASLWGER